MCAYFCLYLIQVAYCSAVDVLWSTPAARGHTRLKIESQSPAWMLPMQDDLQMIATILRNLPAHVLDAVEIKLDSKLSSGVVVTASHSQGSPATAIPTTVAAQWGALDDAFSRSLFANLGLVDLWYSCLPNDLPSQYACMDELFGDLLPKLSARKVLLQCSRGRFGCVYHRSVCFTCRTCMPMLTCARIMQAKYLSHSTD